MKNENFIFLVLLLLLRSQMSRIHFLLKFHPPLLIWIFSNIPVGPVYDFFFHVSETVLMCVKKKTFQRSTRELNISLCCSFSLLQRTELLRTGFSDEIQICVNVNDLLINLSLLSFSWFHHTNQANLVVPKVKFNHCNFLLDFGRKETEKIESHTTARLTQQLCEECNATAVDTNSKLDNNNSNMLFDWSASAVKRSETLSAPNSSSSRLSIDYLSSSEGPEKKIEERTQNSKQQKRAEIEEKINDEEENLNWIAYHWHLNWFILPHIARATPYEVEKKTGTVSGTLTISSTKQGLFYYHHTALCSTFCCGCCRFSFRFPGLLSRLLFHHHFAVAQAALPDVSVTCNFVSWSMPGSSREEVQSRSFSARVSILLQTLWRVWSVNENMINKLSN